MVVCVCTTSNMTHILYKYMYSFIFLEIAPGKVHSWVICLCTLTKEVSYQFESAV